MFGELKQVIASPSVRIGLQLMDAHGITAQVLPELLALRGVEQNEFHHLDVHDHTLEVLDQVAAIQRDPLAAGFGDQATAVGELLQAPLADELSRGDAMRFAALLHDAAKPWTQIRRPDGRLGFPGHDQAGADVPRSRTRRAAPRAACARMNSIMSAVAYWFNVGTAETRRNLNLPEVKIAFLCSPVMDSSNTPPSTGSNAANTSSCVTKLISRSSW